MAGPSIFRRVLVGWDASAGAGAGLRLALRLTNVDGGRLTALAVVRGYHHVEDLEERQRAADEVRVPLQQAFDAVVLNDDGRSPGHATLEFVEAENVGEVLDRYAATHPMDLVVVGLHGREGLLHPKMGHVASHAIRASRCPVLVVPDPDHSPVESTGSRIASLFHPFRHRDPV